MRSLSSSRYGVMLAALLAAGDVGIVACSKDDDARQEMRHLRFQQLEIQSRGHTLTPRQQKLVAQIDSLTRTNPQDQRTLDSLLDLATR